MIILFSLFFSMRDKHVFSIAKEVIISFSKQFTYAQNFPSRIKSDKSKIEDFAESLKSCINRYVH